MPAGGAALSPPSTFGVVSQANVELVLRAPNSVGGRVVDPDKRAFTARVAVVCKGGSLSQSTSDRDPGAFLFFSLSPGPWTVRASTSDGRSDVTRVFNEPKRS